MARRFELPFIALCLIAFAACDHDARVNAPSSQSPSNSSSGGTNLPPAAPLAGLYALQLDLGPGCNVLPDFEKTRRYTASVDYSSGGRYVVTLSDATFLTGTICTAGSRHFTGVGCNQLFASEDIDTASVFLENNNDEAHGGHIVELSASGAWLEITGRGSGKYDRSSITTSGTASVWYCPTPLQYPYPCQSSVTCSADLRLTFRRR